MKRVPRWGKVLIALAAVLVLLVLALPYLLDVDRYRPTILAAIEQETGRKATIGRIRARLLPSIGFTIEDLKIGSPAGFGDHPLVSIDTIRGNLAWGPLLHRRLDVSGITLIKPTIHLIDDTTGKTNYDLTAAKPAAPAADAAPPSSRAAPPPSSFELADLGAVEIREASVVFGSVARPQDAIVTSFGVSNLDATLKDIGVGAGAIKQWRIESDLADVRLTIAGLAPIEVASGTLTLGNGILKATFSAALGNAATVNAMVMVDDIEKSTPRIELTTPLLDLDQISSAIGPAATATPAPAPGTPVRATDAPVSRPASAPSATPGTARKPAAPSRAPVVVGRITADRVRLAPLEGSAAQVDVRVFADRIEASQLSVNVYDGTLGGSARVDYEQAPATLNAAVDLRRLNVAKVLAALSVGRSITGTAAATLQLGGSLSDLPGALTGKGQASMRDGTIPGFGVRGLMGGLAKLTKAGSLGGSNDQASEISYRSISGDLTIAASRIHSRRIHMDSSAGTVDLAGSAGFNQALSYSGRASLFGAPQRSEPSGFRRLFGSVAKQTIGRVPIPFSIRGTFGEPKISPG